MTVLKAPIKAPKSLMPKRLYTILFAGMCVGLFTSCEGPLTSREYEEIVIAPDLDPHDFMGNVPNPAEQQLSLPLSWKVPQGWLEEKGSGMRLATFRDQSGTIECSIVSLGANAGGLRSNVTRWMGQININVPADDQFGEYLSRQKILKTQGSFSMTVIDLWELSREEQAPSMIAAMAELEDKTIFVKMTGNRKDVVSNRDQFISLVQSLAL